MVRIMAKYDLRLKARQLRSEGESVKVIAKILRIARSTSSLWVRDIILTVNQLEKLRNNEIKGAELGRLRGALKQKENRRLRIRQGEDDAKKILGEISERDLFVAGIGLYWAEGAKNRGTIQFFNSDLKMIRLIMLWLKLFFGVEKNEIRARVGVNESHRGREEIIKKYWSEGTGIPLSQFTSTSFKKVKNKKVYENFDQHYGILSLNILKPSRFYCRIMGLINALPEAGCRLASQGVS